MTKRWLGKRIRREKSAGLCNKRLHALSGGNQDMAINFGKTLKLNQVFTPGGQPSVTYVGREHLGIEQRLKQAISQPSNIVSLTGPTKCGKTVLCRSVLSDFEYVWIDGGQIKTEPDLWYKIANELNFPSEVKSKSGSGSQAGAGISGGVEAGLPGNKVHFTMTLGGSRLRTRDEERIHKIDSMQVAIDAMLNESICLVIDDFHYLPEDVRASVIRSLKGPVFRGLKVVLLSPPHRAFEAIKAEAEITGRFKHVTVPQWSTEDLALIAASGFKALNATCPDDFTAEFVKEALGSPLLMQQFCWTLCYNAGILETSLLTGRINNTENIEVIFNEVAQDAGLPIYEKLSKGPQSRTERILRPLKNGDDVDIYQALLMAIAATGPLEKLTYDQIRASLNSILEDKVPQKIEVSNALNHLSTIDEKENKGDRAIDWDGKEP